MNNEKHDGLTGLFRKNVLEEMFLQLVEEGSKRFAIVLIDIDRLIHYNDKYGHLQADEFIKQLAQLISQQIPANSTAFRIGGDEFVILLIEANTTEVTSVAETIRKLTENQFSQIVVELISFYTISETTFVLPTSTSSFTISCGIAFYPDNGDELNTLLAAADNAMYEKAKRLGGNKVALASS